MRLYSYWFKVHTSIVDLMCELYLIIVIIIHVLFMTLTTSTGVTNDDGRTPLHMATQEGHTEVSEYLISLSNEPASQSGMLLCLVI